jgi:Ras GTPase-activating-like protein IQGAP2/3
LRILLEELGVPPEQVKRSENVTIELQLFSRWEIPIVEMATSLMHDALLTPGDILFMDTKCIMVQILRTLPPNQILRPLDFEAITREAASGGRDPVLVRRGLKAQDMLRELKELDAGGSKDNFRLLVEEVEQELTHLGSLRQKMRLEMSSLHSVYQTICDHNAYLKSQLSSYKAYLQNVRLQATGNKPTPASTSNATPAPATTKTLSFTHLQLIEKGVIVKSKIPDPRQPLIFFNMQTPSAGTFLISMHYKGRENPMLEMDLKLDDLLEKQYDNVATLDLEYVTLSVSKTILLLNKSFGKK